MRISDWSSDVCSSDLSKEGNQYPLSGNRFNPPSPCVPLSCESHHLIEQNILRDLTLEVINHNGWPILLDHVDRDSRFIINRLFPECRIKTKKASFCRSEEHTSEIQSLMRISYAVFCLKKTKKK